MAETFLEGLPHVEEVNFDHDAEIENESINLSESVILLC